MFKFLKSLCALIGLLTIILVCAALWSDLHQMNPANGYYPKGDGQVTLGEAVSFDSIDATAEGFAKRGFLMDLLLECRTGRMHLAFFKWRLDIGKMSETNVSLHKPQDACRKRGLQTLF